MRDASLHASVKKVINQIETCNQHAKPFAWTNAEVYRCLAMVKAKATWRLIMRCKKARFGPNTNPRLFDARMEKQIWSTITAVSSGTN